MKRLSFFFNIFLAVHPTFSFLISLKAYQLFPNWKVGRQSFYLACRLSRDILKDVMSAELLYRVALDGSAEEKEASALCMSFW